MSAPTLTSEWLKYASACYRTGYAMEETEVAK